MALAHMKDHMMRAKRLMGLSVASREWVVCKYGCGRGRSLGSFGSFGIVRFYNTHNLSLYAGVYRHLSTTNAIKLISFCTTLARQ